MSVVKREMKAEIVKGNIVITMPIENLVFACENNPQYPLRVNDKTEFAKYIATYILEFDEDETGATAFHRLLDELFEDAYEDGVDMEEIEI